MDIRVEEIAESAQKSKIAEEILRELPDWFSLEDGITKYVDGVKNKPFFVAKIDGAAVGFASVERHGEYSSEIYVMGVKPEQRGVGVGRKLIDYIWNQNKKIGGRFLIVKTLDQSAGDKFYEQTRKFYFKMGFLPLFSTTEIWGEENPCVVMIKTS
ncbi:MAG: GNAT family N-acetyltransferase [Candidatus Nomurabacteria bacterium]|jgi:GNAT superfamily N-acetyltransferase|nr:GNAT family N-acetyltransferase [Candidatus Nomurabacteria bacterium]